jgi:hypothetical protein
VIEQATVTQTRAAVVTNELIAVADLMAALTALDGAVNELKHHTSLAKYDIAILVLLAALAPRLAILQPQSARSVRVVYTKRLGRRAGSYVQADISAFVSAPPEMTRIFLDFLLQQVDVHSQMVQFTRVRQRN